MNIHLLHRLQIIKSSHARAISILRRVLGPEHVTESVWPRLPGRLGADQPIGQSRCRVSVTSNQPVVEEDAVAESRVDISQILLGKHVAYVEVERNSIEHALIAQHLPDKPPQPVRPVDQI